VVGVNYFDDGNEGNYYSDYSGEDNNGDGVGDTPHFIDAENKDNYPLITPIDISTSLSNLTPSVNPTSSPSPTLSPSSSATQQSTLSPSLTPWLEDGHGGLDATRLILIGLLLITVITGAVVYFKKIKKQKPD
jgi:hypothetical protein